MHLATEEDCRLAIANIKAAAHLDLSGRFVVSGRVTLKDRLELELQGKLHLS